jgi:hypothetical protein
MTHTGSKQWAVVQGGAIVRSAASLSKLASLPPGPGESTLSRYIRCIEPLFGSFDHPLMQLHDCIKAVESTVRGVCPSLSDDNAKAVVSVYEAGLLAGYDDLPIPDAEEMASTVSGAVLTSVAATAWEHGRAIGESWRAYGMLVSALIEGDQTC